ncbi:MAG: VCBS repeat-containing protein [Bacteroidota bacterium]
MFRHIPADKSGIYFSNKITETDSINILNFHYIYNGGGIGVGDFDKNGFPDLVFSGNQVASKIYLNKGGLRFEDITETAALKTIGWTTGVSIVDINGDGWQDIYFSVGGYNCEGNCQNQLYINSGIPSSFRPVFIYN